MKAGILAAGLGERFRSAGIETPKPLLELGGRTLFARAVDSAVAAGASSIAAIVNADRPELERAVREGTWPVPIELVVRTTPSSMESLFSLGPALDDDRFLLLTVDAVFEPGALRSLAEAAARFGQSGMLAVTRFVDDEKPLRVSFDDRGVVSALGQAAADSAWVTAGMYAFSGDVFSLVSEARRRRLGALREFLALVLERGSGLGAHRIGTSIDVDRPGDLEAAERFLSELER